MTIPANITTELASLEAQIAIATPLANTSHSNLVAIQLNAINLTADIQTALTTTTLTNLIPTTDSTLLDGWKPPDDAVTIVAGVLNILTASQNQQQLALLRGVVGRATSNLNQI